MQTKETLFKTIIRNNRGLSIAGTRITLYHIMDYIQSNWPPKLIKDRFNLSERQLTDVFNYIQTHKDEVEKEYQVVLNQAEEVRQYWENRNRERFAQIKAMTPPIGKENIWRKVQEKKKHLGLV